jgi:hypothetical protein
MEKKGSDASESTENEVYREKRMEKKRSDASESTFQYGNALVIDF